VISASDDVLGTKKPGLEDRAFCVSGAENRNRTYDLRVTSALLYRLSYFGGEVLADLEKYESILPEQT
jgi:hypothetical protein